MNRETIEVELARMADECLAQEDKEMAAALLTVRAISRKNPERLAASAYVSALLFTDYKEETE